jgi:nicotinamidase/pyrazinamidase
VAETPGAAFSGDLDLPADAQIVSKATSPDRDAYSGFDGTDLAPRLRDLGATRVFVGGLATDYCVRATVLAALRQGFAVVLIGDGVRAVDVTPGDGERALEEMRSAGALPVGAGG